MDKNEPSSRANTMNYSPAKLKQIKKLAAEYGKVKFVSEFLEVSSSKLHSMRKFTPDLDEAIKDGLALYETKSKFVGYEFSKEELEDITDIVRKLNIDSAAKKYATRADGFHRLRKTNKALDEAIKKGQALRRNNNDFQKSMNMFQKLDYTEALEKITDIALEGGIEGLEKHYNISSHLLYKCRRELPKLDAAIRKGLERRLSGVTGRKKVVGADKVAQKPKKTYKTKKNYHEPKRSLVDSTMLAVSDNTDQALANFRKLMQERKAVEHAKRVKSGEYDNLI